MRVALEASMIILWTTLHDARTSTGTVHTKEGVKPEGHETSIKVFMKAHMQYGKWDHPTLRQN